MKNLILNLVLAVVMFVRESSADVSAVGFKRLGNYYINVEGKKSSNEKIYFLSVTFRANWMMAQSFCKSYGMDLLTLESRHEADYFMRSIEMNMNGFEELTHIGGVSYVNEGKENWFWITSHNDKRINYDLKLKPSEADQKAEKNCLQLVKHRRTFSYGRTNCFGNDLQKFVCQKVNQGKSDGWSGILSS